MKIIQVFDLARRLATISILAPIFWSQALLANNTQDLNQLSSDLQTHIYYWAFNGEVSTDPQALNELIDSTAALSESLGLGDYTATRELMEKDVHAQGGPQVLLSLKAASLLKMGVQTGQYAPVNRFLNSLGNFNRQLAEVSSTFVDHTRNQPVGLRQDLQVGPDSRARCLQSCAADFLGLQKNQLFQYMTGTQSKMPSDPRQLQTERAQIGRKFPNDRALNQTSVSGNFESRNTFSSEQQNHCVSVCMSEVSTEILKWTVPLAGALGKAAGIYGAVGGGLAGSAIGSAIGLGVCLNGPECSRTAEREHQLKLKDQELKQRDQELKQRDQELKQREQIIRDNELRMKEEQQERQRKAAEASKKAAEEASKKAAEEASKKKQEQEDSKRKHDEIEKGDWHKPEKNKDAKTDSSTSCESTKSCDGTMTAFVIPEHMRKNHAAQPLKDGYGNILGKLDLVGTPMPKDIDTTKTGVAPKTKLFDNKPSDWAPQEQTILRDGSGKIITNRDMTSTPMPRFN